MTDRSSAMTEQDFQARLTALLQRHGAECGDLDDPASETDIAWHSEFETFALRECDEDQRRRALDQYQLHLLSKPNAARDWFEAHKAELLAEYRDVWAFVRPWGVVAVADSQSGLLRMTEDFLAAPAPCYIGWIGEQPPTVALPQLVGPSSSTPPAGEPRDQEIAVVSALLLNMSQPERERFAQTMNAMRFPESNTECANCGQPHGKHFMRDPSVPCQTFRMPGVSPLAPQQEPDIEKLEGLLRNLIGEARSTRPEWGARVQREKERVLSYFDALQSQLSRKPVEDEELEKRIKNVRDDLSWMTGTVAPKARDLIGELASALSSEQSLRLAAEQERNELREWWNQELSRREREVEKGRYLTHEEVFDSLRGNTEVLERSLLDEREKRVAAEASLATAESRASRAVAELEKLRGELARRQAAS